MKEAILLIHIAFLLFNIFIQSVLCVRKVRIWRMIVLWESLTMEKLHIDTYREVTKLNISTFSYQGGTMLVFSSFS